MLTEREWEWAVNAKMRMSHKNDFRCGKCGVHCYVPYAPCFCVMTKDDFAWEIEFLSRVAANLADPYFPPMDKGSTLEFGHFLMPPADRLRCARLKVEEEMNG